jgi:pimeloyl-ACP methyl ester carboxylesterase
MSTLTKLIMAIILPEDKYVDVDGVSTRYWCLGTKDSSVLFIHGQGGAVDYWYKNVFSMAERHQAYALDWAGSGKTDKPSATYGLDDVTQFIIRFMDVVGLSHSTLVAGSVGGMLALKKASTLILWGRQDRAFPVSHAEIARNRIPDSQLKVFEECGHLPYLEYADEFNTTVLEFLST